MTKMLQEVTSYGTAGGLEFTSNYGIQCAGKTGTTQEDYDRWFVGFTPYYVGGVWFGYDLNQSLSEFWDNPAVFLWEEVMNRIHQKIVDNAENEPIKTFNYAPGVIECTY